MVSYYNIPLPKCQILFVVLKILIFYNTIYFLKYLFGNNPPFELFEMKVNVKRIIFSKKKKETLIFSCLFKK